MFNSHRLFADEAKTVTPKVEQMISLHDELTKKLDEKGAKILMLTNEKNFAKMTKDYVDWLASRRAQIDQVSLYYEKCTQVSCKFLY